MVYRVALLLTVIAGSPTCCSLVPHPNEPARPKPVNLLSLVDLDRDGVAGKWIFDQGVLVAPGNPFNRLRIPVTPPEEYDVRVVIEPPGGSNSLNLGLVAAGRKFSVILDGNSEPRSGLDLVDGKPFYSNVTTVKGQLVTAGSRAEIVCSIRRDGITVRVDGKAVIEWKEGFDRLSLYQGWVIPGEPTLWLGCWRARVRFHALELIPVTGRPQILHAAEDR